MEHYLFIDDSGSKHWETPYSMDFVENPPARTTQNRNFWQDNYFVLAGLYIDSDTMTSLNAKINSEKEKVFGTKHVELHSAVLRNPAQRKEKYLEKYHISDKELRSFIEEFWYPLYDEFDVQLIAVVVDKRYYKNARHEDIIPLDLAAETLFDRTELHPYRECKIIFDQMDSQIKSSKRDQGRIIRIANTQISLDDGKYKNKYHHISVGFDNSRNSNFLQMVDMVAYNVWRQFVDYGDEWDKHSPLGEHRKLPEYKYFTKIVKDFCHDKDNRLSGFGIVKLPDPFNSKIKGWHIDSE